MKQPKITRKKVKVANITNEEHLQDCNGMHKVTEVGAGLLLEKIVYLSVSFDETQTQATGQAAVLNYLLSFEAAAVLRNKLHQVVSDYQKKFGNYLPPLSATFVEAVNGLFLQGDGDCDE
ncbi:MAG: hypothetical protein OXE84_10105, partial [Rhodobacteraceae bacterium]|nr:hypothetical protein [Paracoccaceae bacterium]